jgi:O-antigen/teichoic acid export membrane protein
MTRDMDGSVNDPWLLRRLGAATGGELLAKLLSFLGFVLIARYFEPGTVGALSFGLSLLAVCAVVVSFGLDTLGVRRIARHQWKLPLLIERIAGVKLLLAIPPTLAFLLIVILFFQDTQYFWLVVPLAAMVPIAALQVDYALIGLERNSRLAVKNIAVAVSVLIGLSIAIRHEDLRIISMTMVGSAVLGVAISLLWLRPLPRWAALRWRWRIVAAYIHSSSWIGLSQLTVYFYLQASVLILGMVLLPRELGQYSAAQRLAMGVAMIPGISMQVYSGVVTRSHSVEERSAALHGMLWLHASIGAVVCGNIGLHARELVGLLYGEPYTQAGPILAVLMASGSLAFVNVALANPLQYWTEDRAYFRIVLLGAITALVAIPLSVHFHGLTGAAYAVLFTEAMVLAAVLQRQRSLLHPRNVLPAALLVAVTIVPLLLDARQRGNPTVVTVVFNVCILLAMTFMYGKRNTLSLPRRQGGKS